MNIGKLEQPETHPSATVYNEQNILVLNPDAPQNLDEVKNYQKKVSLF